MGHFSVWGDFEPSEITAALGLQASVIYPKGEMWEGAEHPAKVATWDLHCPPDLTVVEQVNFLLHLLLPSARVIQRLSESYTAQFNVCCEGEGVFSLGAKELHELAMLHVRLNCFIHEDEASDAISFSRKPGITAGEFGATQQ